MKRFMSLLLAMAMLFALSAPALALDTSALDTSVVAPQSDMVVVNLSGSITSQEVQKIVDSTIVGLKKDDGTIVPVESVLTIEDVPVFTYANRMAQNENAYRVTVSATIEGDEKFVSKSDDNNSDYVTASALLQMIWIDGPGLQNAIKEVSGSLRVEKGTVTSATVRWGEGTQAASNWERRDVIGRSSFSYTANYQAIAPKADYQVEFKNSSWPLYMCVASSIFQ